MKLKPRHAFIVIEGNSSLITQSFLQGRHFVVENSNSGDAPLVKFNSDAEGDART
jgi:hypothetical protein